VTPTRVPRGNIPADLAVQTALARFPNPTRWGFSLLTLAAGALPSIALPAHPPGMVLTALTRGSLLHGCPYALPEIRADLARRRGALLVRSCCGLQVLAEIWRA
jgi:hypothetical protein